MIILSCYSCIRNLIVVLVMLHRSIHLHFSLTAVPLRLFPTKIILVLIQYCFWVVSFHLNWRLDIRANNWIDTNKFVLQVLVFLLAIVTASAFLNWIFKHLNLCIFETLTGTPPFLTLASTLWNLFIFHSYSTTTYNIMLILLGWPFAFSSSIFCLASCSLIFIFSLFSLWKSFV